jgi:hypothetical protein
MLLLHRLQERRRRCRPQKTQQRELVPVGDKYPLVREAPWPGRAFGEGSPPACPTIQRRSAPAARRACLQSTVVQALIAKSA